MARSSAPPFLPLLLVLISFLGGLRCDVQLSNSDGNRLGIPFRNRIPFDSVLPQEEEDKRVIAGNKIQTVEGHVKDGDIDPHPEVVKTVRTVVKQLNETPLLKRKIVERSKRQVPGGIQLVSVTHPDVVNVTETAINLLNKKSPHNTKYKLDEILEATRQVVEGAKYDIEAKIVLTDGEKETESEICNIKVWSRPWIEGGTDTTITCGQKVSTFKTRRSVPDRERTLSLERTKRQIPGGIQLVSVTRPDVVNVTETAINLLNEKSPHNTKYKLDEILEATTQVVEGAKYDIKAKIVLTDGEKETESEICNINVWSRPWIEGGTDTTITCGQKVSTFKTRRSVPDRERALSVERSKRQIPGGIQLVSVTRPDVVNVTETAINLLNEKSPHNTKYKLDEILEATTQVVEGAKYDIKAKIVLTDGEKETESEICNINVWSRPWIEGGTDTTITCGQKVSTFKTRRSVPDRERALSVERTKRQIPGGIQLVSVTRPDVVNVTETVINLLNEKSPHNTKYKLDEILEATTQVVEGAKYDIKAKIVLTEGEKETESEICNIKVWSRPWIEGGTDTTITCGQKVSTFKTRRSVPDRERALRAKGTSKSVPVDDPEVVGIAQTCIGQLDGTSSHGTKYKIVKIHEATKQLVAGSLYKIRAEIILTDCPKATTGGDPKLCGAAKGAQPRVCDIEMWTRPWIEVGGTETTIACGEEVSKFRTRRSILL